MAKLLGKWWTGLRLRCLACGDHFELEERDEPQRPNAYTRNVPCPGCGAPVGVDNLWGM